jgi:hypothetical protein
MRQVLGFVIVALLIGAVAACSGSVASEQGLVGTWRFVSYQEHAADGSVKDVWGPNPRGRLIYDAAGRMALQQTAPGVIPFVSGDLLRGTDDEVKQAFAGYRAWFGSYTVDSKAGVIVHHIEGSLFPNYVGTDQRRFFSLSGNRLTLRTPPIVRGGQSSTFEMVWDRDK